MRLIFAGLVFSAFSYAQTFSLGVIGGAPFTDVLHGATVGPSFQVANNTSKYTIGPSAQWNLPLGLRVEVDALFRPYGFEAIDFSIGGSPRIANVSEQQWRFPVLLQYRFPIPVARPFVEAGPSFEHLTGQSSLSNFFVAPTHTSSAGIVLGGGVDLRIPFLRVSAELRYTRQTSANYPGVSNLNQAEVLFGVHF